MNLNPEFQRQLYLEFSLARFIGVPLFLAFIFTLTFSMDHYQFAQASEKTALGLFFLITMFWGAKQVVDSIFDEQRSHTWDTQRLSALGPMAMTFGKLLGSTLIVWYGGVLCLAVYVVAADSGINLLWTCSYLIGGGLLVQNISMLLSLIALGKGQKNGGSMIMVQVVVLIIFLGFFWFDAPANQYTSLPVVWYGINDSCYLRLFNLFLTLFWSGVGNYRLMTKELRIRTFPWVWLVFCLFMIVYSGGYLSWYIASTRYYNNLAFIYYFCVMALGVCSALSYLVIISDHNDPMSIKRLFCYAKQQNWHRFLQQLPLWCISFLLCLPFALFLFVLFLAASTLSDGFNSDKIRFYPLAILLLLFRDIGIYLFFSYGKNPGRAFSLFLLFMILLYGIVPGLFFSAHQPLLAAVILPYYSANAGLASVYAIAQITLVWTLLYQRWQASVAKTGNIIIT